jgi:co-chaperonin GroES (HSP10)
MKQRVLRDLVLIAADESKKQTDSGLLIHEEWQTLPPWGTVLAVGPEVTEVKEGDRVLFERYGSIILDKTSNERMCRENQIMAVEIG